MDSRIAVHITHEACRKYGGIGSVITGLCTNREFNEYFDRSVLYGPLFQVGAYGGASRQNQQASDPSAERPSLFAERPSVADAPPSEIPFEIIDCGDLLDPLCDKFGIDVIYGKRILVDESNPVSSRSVDVVLVDTEGMAADFVKEFKTSLQDSFAFSSLDYSEHELDQYLKMGIPYPEIMKCLYPQDATFYHFAHEFMGIPAILALLLSQKDRRDDRLIYYAHEIPPCRTAVESETGHDISFYNRMRLNRRRNRSFESVYGSQFHSCRAELVKCTVYCDRVIAVSELVLEEYLYFIPQVEKQKMRVVYNGIPVSHASFNRKMQSRKLLQRYVKNLIGYVPDYIFTHVSRSVVSKGIWRDIALLHVLDRLLQGRRQTAVYILLSTSAGSGRDAKAILDMEDRYGWPVTHHEGWPDLVGYESDIYRSIGLLNSRSKNLKGLYLNQFGFSRSACGARMPEQAEFIDLRMGSDAEFGLSIYEPFGISQLEVMPFGGIAVLSTSCGALSALQEYLGECGQKLYVPFDFIGGGQAAYEKAINGQTSLEQAPSEFIDSESGVTPNPMEIESAVIEKMGYQLMEILPKHDRDRRLAFEIAQQQAERLGWNNAVRVLNLRTL